MFVCSLGKKSRKAAALAALALLLVVLCAVIGIERKEKIPPYATSDEAGRFFTEVSDSDSIDGFLSQFDLSAEEKPLLKDKVSVPSEFDSVYEKYNELQKKSGFDLSRFKGAEVNRLVLKEKGADERITLLIYKGHVIGAHISTGEFGSEYRPLS